MMNITIIGSGNVACALAEAIYASDKLHLSEICARNAARGKEIAEKYGVQHISSPENLKPADLYIISVSDSAIESVASRIPAPESSVVAHTSGGLSIETLESIRNRAVIYPLQTFSAGRSVDMHKVPLFIEFSNVQAEQTIRAAADALSDIVCEADSDIRRKLHISAVFACNFTNQMYTLAAQFLKTEGLDFTLLRPLIEETTAKAMTVTDPSTVQTGPAARGDEVTMRRHEQILADKELGKHLEIYKLLSNNIWETLKKT